MAVFSNVWWFLNPQFLDSTKIRSSYEFFSVSTPAFLDFFTCFTVRFEQLKSQESCSGQEKIAELKKIEADVQGETTMMTWGIPHLKKLPNLKLNHRVLGEL